MEKTETMKVESEERKGWGPVMQMDGTQIRGEKEDCSFRYQDVWMKMTVCLNEHIWQASNS